MTATRSLRRSLAAGVVAATALATAPAPAHALDPPVAFWSERTADLAVNGTYLPVVGDFGAPLSPADDILWYAPGATTDYLWYSLGNGTFDKDVAPVQISGSYTPVVGDFAGTTADDIVWYAPGAAQDYLWTSIGGDFTSTPISVSGTYVPAVLDDQVGKDDILWAAPNGGAGHVWSFEGGGAYLSKPITSPTGSRPLVGRFGPGSCADVFWYTPGPGADSLWWMDCAGQASTTPQTVNGTYQPVVADLDATDGAGWSEILWYRTGAPSTLWSPTGDFGKWEVVDQFTIPLAGTPLPVSSHWGAVQIWSTTAQDLISWGDGPTDDAFLGPVANTEAPVGAMPVIGRFVGHGEDIFWYRPGPGAERLFHRHP